MSLPKKYIDSLDFARTESWLEGTLDVADLSRLKDVLTSTDGALDVRLEGARDNEGKSWLHLRVAGQLMLVCQRCLGGRSFRLAIDSRLQLIAPGKAWPDEDLEDDSSDAIASDPELALLTLIEDEVLLALPIVPRHESCESPQINGNGNGKLGSEYGLEPKVSAFSALIALKKS